MLSLQNWYEAQKHEALLVTGTEAQLEWLARLRQAFERTQIWQAEPRDVFQEYGWKSVQVSISIDRSRPVLLNWEEVFPWIRKGRGSTQHAND